MLVRSAHRIVIGVTVLALMVGCSPASRGVGSQPAPITLTLAGAFEVNTELQPFVDAVARLSDGTMQIVFKPNVHAGEDAAEESLLGDVAAGTYDMTWTAQRPWPARSDKAFDALVAPFLIDSYDLERAVLEDPIAQQMISSVKGAGLVGIGVLPGPLRFIDAHDPVRAPSDLKGSVIGIDDTWVGAETVKALGGTVAVPTTNNLSTLTGAVAQLGAIVGNRWNSTLPAVAAGIPFWPRPVIVVMNQARFDALSDAQRRILHDAAATSIARRTEQLAGEDELAVQGICRTGSIPVASAADRLAFRSAVSSVYDQLDRDTATAAFIKRIDELKAGLAANTPYACAEAVAQGSESPALGIPDGTYRLSITPAEVEAWIRANKVPADAKLAFPVKDCPCTYSFTVHGTELLDESKDPWKLSYFGGDHVSIGDFAGTYGFRWSYADNTLTLSDITGGAWEDAEVWTIKPWVRDR
jgi:TRAP-type C4-dicarboxylate transport system substrate-binding protein